VLRTDVRAFYLLIGSLKTGLSRNKANQSLTVASHPFQVSCQEKNLLRFHWAVLLMLRKCLDDVATGFRVDATASQREISVPQRSTSQEEGHLAFLPCDNFQFFQHKLPDL